MDGISLNLLRLFPIISFILRLLRQLDKDIKLCKPIFQELFPKILRRILKMLLRFLWELRSVRLIKNISLLFAIRFLNSLIIVLIFKNI